eukprot:TRINITY_DN31133_c0_g1_i1.p1 TRINITY_DN31133_c0_g1~~TRINITY_DN31133_c0_g1_i1.p1  ORF type:complete len:241 (-),score=61.69 TRINITY_DN31133_c0_g1_i1:35-757(-)
MVIVSKLDELKPPGGSSFGGHFNKTAFASYVYPRGRQLNRDGTQMANHSEQREVARLVDPGVCQSAAILYKSAAFADARLSKNYAEKGKDVFAQRAKEAKLMASASSPALVQASRQLEPQEEGMMSSRPSSSLGDPAQPQQGLTEFEASRAMNSRWYPHVSLNRGTLKLTAPQALAYGVDPGKDHGHVCPFFEGPKHRFEAVQSLPEAKLKIPDKSLRWLSDDHWNREATQTSLKITSFR